MTREQQQAFDRRKPFRRQIFIERDELLAARWWFEGMQAQVEREPSRRKALMLLAGMGGLVGTGLLLRAGCRALRENDVTMDALELQRKEGWAVGAQGKPLLLRDRVSEDSAGSSDWSASLASLAKDLAPGDPALEPFFVPTLFDVLGNPRGSGLLPLIGPMHSGVMDVANRAARALASLFGDEEDGKKTALILDLPGPESVAAAAGVARVFTPVFLYDNWPHPLGVVASHETLAAAIYHRPDLAQARAAREKPTSPAFVLDWHRLAPYRDESDRFDNRYLARLPGADGFAKLGISRVLYVTAFPESDERDDLNDDFVALQGKSIDVKMVALSDFGPAPQQTLRENNLPVSDRTYYYGGHPHGSFFFWSSYHWYSPGYSGRSFSGTLPQSVSGGRRYTPMPRPTMFSSRTVGGLAGVGRQRPSGFGRVSYRAGSGTVGRSGSLGRAGGSSFG